MTETENLTLTISVKSAAQGLKMALSTLDTVHYLLARAEGDLSVQQRLTPDSLSHQFMAETAVSVAESIKAVKELKQKLLNARNKLGQP